MWRAFSGLFSEGEGKKRGARAPKKTTDHERVQDSDPSTHKQLLLQQHHPEAAPIPAAARRRPFRAGRPQSVLRTK